ncbi:MAG: M61 family metallopeptidase [Planctomycetota bacterium]|jgi:predicted metalloprotease with PDZ domain
MPSAKRELRQRTQGVNMVFSSLCGLAIFIAVSPQDIDRGSTRAEYRIMAQDAKGDGERIPLQVEMTIHHPPRPFCVAQIPVWTPGSYRLRDFPEQVKVLSAKDAEGSELEVIQLRRDSWQVATGDSAAVTISYRVDLKPRDRFMMVSPERRCLTFEGPKVYMYLRDHTDIPCQVRFELPQGWSAASGLVDQGDGLYFAQDYDFLADCPVKIGEFQRFSFESHGKPIDVVVDALEDLDFDSKAWLANIKKIVDCQGDIFGGFAFDRYTFLYTASPRGGGGGLEHLTSTAIGVRAPQLIESPLTGMGITAHEFFHNWNVKRLRPAALGPFDYSRPNRSTGLWVAEGITSYYTDVTLARVGMRSEAQFWSSMQGQINNLENNPAREHVSSAMASYGVWEAKPRDRNLSYYNSGQVIGLLLDIEIRAGSENRSSLDDYMRILFDLCQTRNRGFEDHELVSVASSLCRRDMQAWFDRHVFGTVVPPYAEILSKAGMKFTETKDRRKVIRGIGRRGAKGQLYYQDPNARGPQFLVTDGVVTQVAGRPVKDMVDLGEQIARYEEGQSVELTLEHAAQGEFTLSVAISTVPTAKIELKQDSRADKLARSIRDGIIARDQGR